MQTTDTRPSFMPKAQPKAPPPPPTEIKGASQSRPSFMPKAPEVVRGDPVLRKWSFSAWSLFKDVPYILYAQEVLGRRRDSGAAANRGTEMHAQLEQYILSNRQAGEPDPVGKAYVDGLYHNCWELKPEERFTLSADWTPVPEEQKAMTAIMDVLATRNGYVHIGDYKTGRKYDIKHTQQAQLYAAVANQVLGVDECEAQFVYLDGHDPLYIRFDKRIMQQAVDFWKKEGEKMLTMDRSYFYPPEDLAGVPKWFHEFLTDPSNYDDDHFKKPWYARKSS